MSGRFPDPCHCHAVTMQLNRKRVQAWYERQDTRKRFLRENLVSTLHRAQLWVTTFYFSL